jgi:SAM-dependent methyltransferase
LAILSIGALLSCRGAPTDPPSDAGLPLQSAPEATDETAIKAMSHALLDAYDRDDEDSLAKVLAPSFTFFSEQQAHHREVLGWVHDRRAHGAAPRTRTYGQEHISISENTAVFIGEAVLHAPADGQRPAGEFDGWNTLVWAREGTAWKAMTWQWVKGGLDADRARWDATYSAGRAFNPAPSRFLVDVVKQRKPGVALDIAMGQGRNSLYLASQGWRVTGIDISNEGLRLARQAAAERKLTIEAINADDATWDYGVDKWDLVALIYAGCDAKLVATLRTSLKRAGIVVIEGFHKDAAPPIGFATGELASLFKDGFTIVRDDVVEEESDWGLRNGVREKLIHFVAEKR